MHLDYALARLRPHEVELPHMGIASFSLFGSLARGEAMPNVDVDVDVAATFADNARLLHSRLTS